MEDGRIFLITSTPLSLKIVYRKNLISAWSISLDSTSHQKMLEGGCMEIQYTAKNTVVSLSHLIDSDA